MTTFEDRKVDEGSTERFLTSRWKPLIFAVTPTVALMAPQPPVIMALLAAFSVLLVAFAIGLGRRPLVEVDSNGLTIHRRVGEEGVLESEVTGWTITRSALVVGRRASRRLATSIGLLSRKDVRRLEHVLEARFGPADESLGATFRGEANRRIAIAVFAQVAIMGGVFMFIWMKEPPPPAKKEPIRIPASPRPPKQWPGPQIVSSADPLYEGSPYVGLWRYPGRSAWVDIGEDATIYQCRVSEGSTYVSTGWLLSDSRIEWAGESWGADRVVAQEGGLLLEGPSGSMPFVRVLPDAEGDLDEIRRRLRRFCQERIGTTS